MFLSSPLAVDKMLYRETLHFIIFPRFDVAEPLCPLAIELYSSEKWSPADGESSVPTLTVSLNWTLCLHSSPWVASKALKRFPSTSPSALIPDISAFTPKFL